MRSCTSFLLLLICVAAGGCSDIHTGQKETDRKAVETIKACRERDLQTLESEQVRELLHAMTKLGLEREYQDQVDRYGPWYVFDFMKTGKQPLFLLFEAGKKMQIKCGNSTIRVHPHPGSTPVSMTLLDDSGKVVSETHLTIGWRCYLRNVKLQSFRDEDFPLVVLETELGSGSGPDIARQFYARLGQGFDLIRLENSDGIAVRNEYYVKHFRCGPAVPNLTETEWEAELMSVDQARVLRALVWLGGVHWDLQADGTADQLYEELNQVHLWRKVRGREKVLARIRELVKSDDPWLREAAGLAADPQDAHF